MRNFSLFILMPLFVFLLSCGDNSKLEVDGDQEAIELAEKMMKAMGGKKAWQKVRSVYIRTISHSSAMSGSYVFEEWINLDEPKFMNRRNENDHFVMQIVDHNDGWTVTENNVAMISPANITGYLDWHHQYLLVNLKKLAMEKENIILKLKGNNHFDLYLDGRITAGFELDENHLIKRYLSYGKQGSMSVLLIKDYREYEGYVFPLKLTIEGTLTEYETDYFDPSPLAAEKAFPISFNPNDYMK